MREPPDLAEDAIVGALQAGFGIRVAGLWFLPVGNDADSWAYRVQAGDGPAWFLKVRSGTAAMPGAAVPAYLHRRGTPGVLAPLPTRAGEPYLVAGRFALALYPMLDARQGAEAGLSSAQWLLSPTAGEATRRAAVESFEDLFAPGNIVDLAGP